MSPRVRGDGGAYDSRMVSARLAAALFVVCLAAPAAAGPVGFASGGPAGEQDAVIASLEQARTLMTVCWRKPAPATIKVELAVDAAGEVTKAVAKTKGAAAQCAAGILAVSTLPATGKKWKGVVELKPAAPGQAADARAIHDQLATKHQAALFACQDADAAFAGKVMLKLTVQQDGAVSAATASGEGMSKALAKCLEKVARGLTFDPLSSTSVTYELGLTFAGGGKGGGGAGKGGGGDGVELDAALQPSRKGPIDADAAAEVIRGGHAGLVKCARKHKPEGVVTIRVEVGADGATKSVKVKSSAINDAKAEQCVVDVFRAMKFPRASGDSVILYPVGFSGAKVRVGS